ncbi:NADP-dependent oxidoreductase [Chitinophaga tropicalis]|uniref:Zinc-binding dehydrogenase n=1 Tax=Chitinophaga tropicalis TaxID=2683588 RepID=A0A7K1UCW4_9BACT|nr:NADP-dependent oxidoreductase [Chitinophaga tropicalis]MVT12183.1 zinc-binding dehydrogenase [Chitinophaga tropicalis]
MKAIILKEEKLQLADIQQPQIKENEVLVQVKAISINPVDNFMVTNPESRERIMGVAPGEEIIVGWDISGIVTQVGRQVTDIKVGDAVFGMVNFPGHGKAYAEYVAAPAAHLALKPDNISHEEAAAATLAALTAWQALVTQAKVKKNEKVLIHVAAGGVGHYAVQLAKHFGAHVIATASAANREFVLGLGADEFIDYQTEKFEEKIKDADVVLDAVYGEEHLLRSLEVVKPGGRVISLLTFFDATPVAEKVKEKQLYAYRLLVASSGEDMKSLAALLENGSIRSYVTGTYSFERLPEAHEQIAGRRTRGKIVVTL